MEAEDGDDGEGGWGGVDDLDLPTVPDADLGPADSSFFVTPSAGVPLSQRWTQKSSLAGEHAAAGAFDTAFRLLSRQIGAVDFAPLKPFFMEAFLASHTFVPGVAGMPSASFGVERGWTEQVRKMLGWVPLKVPGGGDSGCVLNRR